MRPADIARLVALGAIWGASFVFMRVVSPSLGPLLTTFGRLFIAGSLLILYFRITGYDVRWRDFGKHYFVIGALNSAIPFSLFAFAALHIPASHSAVMNSTAPLWGAVFAALWLNDRLTARKLLGLVLGSLGVFLIAREKGGNSTDLAGFAVAAGLTAAACYGLTAVYIKKFTSGIPSMAIAGASQLAAGLLLLPAFATAPAVHDVTLKVALSLGGLSLLCSGVAYLLYFRLVADIGPTRALTVTFLIPVFATLWGALFLGETVTLMMLCGAVSIVAGTAAVLSSRAVS